MDVKSRGRSKFFMCFSPVLDDDEEFGRKKRGRRGFAAAMKAVFFKVSLAKKSRSKKSKEDPFRSNSGYSSSSAIINAKFVNNTNKNPDELLLLRANSNASSIFSPGLTDSSRSSSRSSSISSNSRSGSERIKQSSSSMDFKQTLNPQTAVKRDGREKCGCTVGMCIFLICLVTLVFWGKVSAIVTCTSACLFFAPACRPHRRCRPESSARSVDLSLNDDVESEEDKKRVIMEGLLERNRPRVLLLGPY